MSEIVALAALARRRQAQYAVEAKRDDHLRAASAVCSHTVTQYLLLRNQTNRQQGRKLEQASVWSWPSVLAENLEEVDHLDRDFDNLVAASDVHRTCKCLSQYVAQAMLDKHHHADGDAGGGGAQTPK